MKLMLFLSVLSLSGCTFTNKADRIRSDDYFRGFKEGRRECKQTLINELRQAETMPNSLIDRYLRTRISYWESK